MDFKAIQDIDRIIDLIKKSNSRPDAKVKLLKEFTERQANAILI